jgi:hypothetical protein
MKLRHGWGTRAVGRVWGKGKSNGNGKSRSLRDDKQKRQRQRQRRAGRADYIPTHVAMKLRHGWGTRAVGREMNFKGKNNSKSWLGELITFPPMSR